MKCIKHKTHATTVLLLMMKGFQPSRQHLERLSKENLKASEMYFFEVAFAQVHDILTEEQQAVSSWPSVLKIPHTQRP